MPAHKRASIQRQLCSVNYECSPNVKLQSCRSGLSSQHVEWLQLICNKNTPHLELPLQTYGQRQDTWERRKAPDDMWQQQTFQTSNNTIRNLTEVDGRLRHGTKTQTLNETLKDIAHLIILAFRFLERQAPSHTPHNNRQVVVQHYASCWAQCVMYKQQRIAGSASK